MFFQELFEGPNANQGIATYQQLVAAVSENRPTVIEGMNISPQQGRYLLGKFRQIEKKEGKEFALEFLGDYGQIGITLAKVAEKLDESVNTQSKLSVGDPIIVTAPNAYQGKTGEIVEFSPRGSFVIVQLYNGDKATMHLSDINYNEHADKEEADDFWNSEDDGYEETLEAFLPRDPEAERQRKADEEQYRRDLETPYSPEADAERTDRMKKSIDRLSTTVNNESADDGHSLERLALAAQAKARKDNKYMTARDYRHNAHQDARDAQKKDVKEAKGLGKCVEITRGPDAGKIGYVRQIKTDKLRGIRYLDLDLKDGGQTVVKSNEVRIVKEQGVAEGWLNWDSGDIKDTQPDGDIEVKNAMRRNPVQADTPANRQKMIADLTTRAKAGDKGAAATLAAFKRSGVTEGASQQFIVTLQNVTTKKTSTVLVPAYDEDDAKDMIRYRAGRDESVIDARPARGNEQTTYVYKVGSLMPTQGIEEEVTPPQHYGGQGNQGAQFDIYMQKRKEELEKQRPQGMEEGWSGNEPTWVCVNGKKWKLFSTHDHARNVGDKLQAKFRREGRKDQVSYISSESENETDESREFTAITSRRAGHRPGWALHPMTNQELKQRKERHNTVAKYAGKELPAVKESNTHKDSIKKRDPNWKTMSAKRSSGAAGAHTQKGYTRKEKHKQQFQEAPGAETLSHNQNTVASNEKAMGLAEATKKKTTLAKKLNTATAPKLWKAQVSIKQPNYVGRIEVTVTAANAQMARQLMMAQYGIPNWKVGSVTPVKESTERLERRYNEPGITTGNTMEGEGDPEGLPHLTPELASHISQQINTEGPHAVVKSVEWGDGASKELLAKIKEMLDDYAAAVEESAAWQRKEGKSKTGGLNKKGVASYRREHPGSKLQTAVTKKPSKIKKGSKDDKRRKSFCARMGGMKGPMKDKNGKPTRKALALRKWHCESVEQFEAMIESHIQQARTLQEGLKDPKDNPCWKGYHPVGTKKKNGKTVPNCVPVNETESDDLKPGQYYIWQVFFDDGSSKKVKVTNGEIDLKQYYAKKDKNVIKVEYNWTKHG